MPSVFGHGLVGVTGQALVKKWFAKEDYKKLFILSLMAANFPDVDVFFHYIGTFGYEGLEHRNLFHSFVFVVPAAFIFSTLFFKKETIQRKLWLSFYFFLPYHVSQSFRCFN